MTDKYNANFTKNIKILYDFRKKALLAIVLNNP